LSSRALCPGSIGPQTPDHRVGAAAMQSRQSERGEPWIPAPSAGMTEIALGFTIVRECVQLVRWKTARSCPRRLGCAYAVAILLHARGRLPRRHPKARAGCRRSVGNMRPAASRLEHRGRGATPRCPERAETAMLYAKSPARGGMRPPSFFQLDCSRPRTAPQPLALTMPPSRQAAGTKVLQTTRPILGQVAARLTHQPDRRRGDCCGARKRETVELLTERTSFLLSSIVERKLEHPRQIRTPATVTFISAALAERWILGPEPEDDNAWSILRAHNSH
jgi:hypothetical protein